MGLPFSEVEKAYKVFNEIKRAHLPSLRIPSWPEDMSGWSKQKCKYPSENIVYGFDHKRDDGWENLFFFVRDPSTDLIKKFDELKTQVANSSMSELYSENPELWIFGWF